MTISTLMSIRDSASFVAFWQKVTESAAKYDIKEPELPRKWKVPGRFDDGLAPPEFSSCAEDHYRQIYFEALDNVIQGLTDRFNQPGYAAYSHLEQLLIKACQGDNFKEDLDFCSDFYGDGLDKTLLEAQLCTLHLDFIRYSEKKFDNKLKKSQISISSHALLGEVNKFVQLVLVMPATDSTSERSFSALRRVKTYLRSTVDQEGLNNL